MAIADVIEVNVEDIQRFVEGQVKASNAPSNSQTEANNNPQHFTVNRQEYIDFLISQRDLENSKFRRSLFWAKVNHATLWVLKFILGSILFLCLCWGFYFLVWFMQNSLYFHWLNAPVRP